MRARGRVVASPLGLPQTQASLLPTELFLVQPRVLQRLHCQRHDNLILEHMEDGAGRSICRCPSILNLRVPVFFFFEALFRLYRRLRQ